MQSVVSDYTAAGELAVWLSERLVQWMSTNNNDSWEKEKADMTMMNRLKK